MHYKIIVIGATFAAAGIVSACGDDCLVLERRPQAGYEVFNAINFGHSYETQLKSLQAKQMYQDFSQKGAFSGERICLFPCAEVLYRLLENKNVLLNMDILSVVRENGIFTVTACGVSGCRTFTADRVVDTRVHPNMVREKSLNLIINTDREGLLPPAGVSDEKWGHPGDLLVKLPVSREWDYLQARKAVLDYVSTLPEAFRVVFVADCFCWTVDGTFPEEKDGICYLPSVWFANPLVALDEGVCFAREVLL